MQFQTFQRLSSIARLASSAEDNVTWMLRSCQVAQAQEVFRMNFKEEQIVFLKSVGIARKGNF